MNAIAPITVSFGDNDRVLLAGVECRLLEQSKTSYYFYEVERPQSVRQIAISALPALLDQPAKFRHDRDYYTLQNIELRAQKKLGPAELAPAQVAQMEHRYTLAKAFRAQLATIPLNMRDREQVALDAVQLEVAMSFLRRETRSALSLRDRPISVETVKEWDKRLRDHDDNPACLADGRWKNSGNHTPRFTPEEEKYFSAAVDQYLQPTRPSIKATYIRLADAIMEENLKREARGEPLLRCLHLKSFEKRIANISPFVKQALRVGLASAEKHFRVAHGGIRYLRPGQRMEVDGWVCHLHSLLEGTTLWLDLPQVVRERAKSIRLTFIVVIDVATRSILGIQFSTSENAEAVSAALRMSLEDKQKYVKAFGCKSTWPQYGWGTWTHDRGAAFSSEELIARVLKGVNADQSTVPGVPWLRGTIEAFFRTMNAQLIAHFMGQTGSNPISRTEYQTAENASVTTDELIEKTIQWIVDGYHNTVHPALGITPLQAWFRFSQIDPPPPRHGPMKMIEIFGHQEKRMLGHTGICIANGQFNSNQLQLLRRLLSKKSEQEVTVWIDYENLGQVLVKIEDRFLDKADHTEGWMLVSGPQDFAGASLRQIDLADKDMEERFGIDKLTSETRARHFRASLHQFASDSAKLRLSSKPLTLDFVQKRMGRTFHYALGDDEFLRDLQSLHAPVRLAGRKKSAEPLADTPVIEISFEDEK